MTVEEAVSSAIEELICVTRDEAIDLIEALRRRGFEIQDRSMTIAKDDPAKLIAEHLGWKRGDVLRVMRDIKNDPVKREEFAKKMREAFAEYCKVHGRTLYPQHPTKQ